MLNQRIREQVKYDPTPFYLYDLALLDKTIAVAQKAAVSNNIRIHYALKANYNAPLVERISAAGFGADCVSGAEIIKAIASGFSPSDIVMAGVGKTDAEIDLALKAGIACLNVESEEELTVIAALAKTKGVVAPVALRINPDINASTHQFITTGTLEDKFGVSTDELPRLLSILQQNPSIQLKGLHFHIGSQISDHLVFDRLCAKVNALNKWFYDQNIFFPMINMGGGLSINYVDPDTEPIAAFDSYFSGLQKNLHLYSGQQIHVELGRSIVGQCGSIVSKVLYKKRSGEKEFLILDAGMTELIRPALYGARHKIQKLFDENESSNPILPYEVVGPICESSDSFGSAVLLPAASRGDLLIIRSTGAYGEVMSSNYNLREKARIVYIR